MRSKTVNIGIIGAGMVARAHMDAFFKDKRTRIIWLCDVTLSALEESAKKYNVPNRTDDYSEMLEDPELKAVVICTPPSGHCKIAVDVLKMGKHLLIEKPMVLNIIEARKVIAEAKRHPELVVTEGSSRHSRVQPKFSFIKSIIDSGELGDIYFIHHNVVNRQARGGIESHPTAKWFLNRSIAGGGPLFDWGVYDLSFHLGILSDKPRLISLSTFAINGLDKVCHHAPVFNVEEHGAAFMKFDTGLSYFWERANNAHNESVNETRLYGTKGGLKFNYLSWGSNEVEMFYVDRKGRGKARKNVLKVDMSGHKGDMSSLDKNFADAILNSVPVATSLEIAAKHIEIIQKIYKVAGW